MTTARDIIKKSLQKIGALVKGEAPSADEAEDGLAALNSIISSWSNDSLVLYARTLESFTLSGGVAGYTIGSGGDFNTVRPLDIVDAYVRIGNIDYPLTQISDETYDSIALKIVSTIPQFYNFNGGYPLATIKLYPVPAGAYQIFLRTEKAITQFTTLDTDMSLPDGWERALIYNLAIDLAPEYSQPVTVELVKIANESLGNVRLGVIKNRPMDAYPQNAQVRNIFTGWYI